ncbi:hypothetical protein GGR21_002848 [Dysgonomonas hofstadii]|uniref:Uncharacterized protein n=1 Tax=Dysgonomonas hofstadii TaxID=637886 RepID=A0A840CTD2_9BACT|nr:hypothetical protein [Dysgonomonas hofstadii]
MKYFLTGNPAHHSELFFEPYITTNLICFITYKYTNVL